MFMLLKEVEPCQSAAATAWPPAGGAMPESGTANWLRPPEAVGEEERSHTTAFVVVAVPPTTTQSRSAAAA